VGFLSLILELPDRLLAKLREISESRGIPVEELILESLYKYLNILDRNTRVEMHLKLCDKYLREAEGLLSRREYTQTSGKLWAAVTQIVIAVASKRDLMLDTHTKLWEFIAKLRAELNDPELGRLWSSANALHRNSYEAQIPPELVKDYAQDVIKLIEKLRKLA
jgi:hypothetical protein